jgi:hypothetical protein
MMPWPRRSPSAIGAARGFGAHGRGCGRPRCVWRQRSSRERRRHLPIADAQIEPATSARRIGCSPRSDGSPGASARRLVLRFYASYGTDEIARMLGSRPRWGRARL